MLFEQISGVLISTTACSHGQTPDQTSPVQIQLACSAVLEIQDPGGQKSNTTSTQQRLIKGINACFSVMGNLQPYIMGRFLQFVIKRRKNYSYRQLMLQVECRCQVN